MSSHGMTMAHCGLAIAIFGFVGSSAWKSEKILFVKPGSRIEIAGFDVTFDRHIELQESNYVADRGIFSVYRNGKYLSQLTPERRYYVAAESTTTESSIRSTLAGDLYASLAAPSSETAKANGEWTLRILYEPLVNFIWIGALMLVLGAGMSLLDRRHRIGVPKPRIRS